MDIVFRQLVLWRERVLAGKALGGGRFFKLWIEGDPPVEHETVALVMSSATFLKILEDAAVELIDLLETPLFHQWPRLFAADAPGAEHDNRLGFRASGSLPIAWGKSRK